jgi:acetyl-CoA C-acetyltransferase
MSLAPHAQHLRAGTKMGDLKLIDTMIKDGLTDAFNGYHMGNTAENVARQWQLTRDEQDSSRSRSQNKAEAAQKAGKFKDEIVAGDHQGPQGRHDRRPGRVHPPWRHHRGHAEAEARPSTRKAP